VDQTIQTQYINVI